MKNTNIRLLIVFIPVITGLSLVYKYPETLLKRPQSVHNWRQCDGSSLALNYYQEGMHFFKPQTHMLYSDGMRTGYTAPSEIPLLYYFTAILYHVFGYHEFIFRAVNLLIFFIGLFYLFKLAFRILNDVLYSLIVTVLIFSSPLLVYYANNFMPNTVALALSFIGWYYFYSYYVNGKTRTFLVSIFFFGLAGAMKITELTGPIIIVALMIAERLRILNSGLHSKESFGIKLGSVALIIAIVAGWVLYAKYYNNLHQSTQFSTYTFPIWSMNQEDIRFTLHKMNVLWFKDYFYPVTFWFMIASLIVMVGLFKRSDRLLMSVSLIMTFAVFAFSMLWFQALGDHDYFFIGFYVLPAFLFINFFGIIRKSGYGHSEIIIRVVFILVLFINVYHARQRHIQRYTVNWINDYPQQKDLYSIDEWLSEEGFGRDDTIIFYPSVYIRPLYLMNLKGWIVKNHDEATPEIEKRDSLLMSTYVSNGADYFITSDLKSAAEYKPFQSYMTELYSRYNSIFIFRIPARNVNFNPKDSAAVKTLSGTN